MNARSTSHLLLLLLLAGLASGCSTAIKVQKVKPDNNDTVAGLRYALPATFIAVEPDATKRGAYTVEPVFWPNQSETYAIAASSTLGSLTFDAKIEGGLLTKVVIKKNTGDVAGAAIDATGEVIKARLDAEKEAEKKAEEKAAEAKKKLQELKDAAAKADKTLALARTKVEEWQKLVDRYPENSTYQQKLIEAKVEQQQATIDLQAANDALNEFLDSQKDLSAAFDVLDDLAKDTRQSTEQRKAAWPKAHGPIYYRLLDTCDPLASLESLSKCEVKLVPVNWSSNATQQMDFPVSEVPPIHETADPKAPQLADVPSDNTIIVEFKNGFFEDEFALTASVCSQLKHILTFDMAGSEKTVDPKEFYVKLTGDRKKIALRLAKDRLPPRTYYLTLHLYWGNCDSPKEQPIELKLIVK